MTRKDLMHTKSDTSGQLFKVNKSVLNLYEMTAIKYIQS